MLWFIIFVNCSVYNIKLCKFDEIYLQAQSCYDGITPDCTQSNAIVSFSKIESIANLRVIKLEKTPGLVFNTNNLTQEIVFLPFADLNEQKYKILPVDFISCFRILQNGRCITYDENSNKYKLEECVKSDFQLFEFICLNCLNSSILSRGSSENITSNRYSEEIKALENNMGRLDKTTYRVLKEMLKITKNISQCFTINSICYEHAVELQPFTCFDDFKKAHNLLDNVMSFDRTHHMNTIGRTKSVSILDDKFPTILNKKAKDDEDMLNTMNNILKAQLLNQGAKDATDAVISKFEIAKDLLPDQEKHKKNIIEDILNNVNGIKDQIADKIEDKLSEGGAMIKDSGKWIGDLVQKVKDAKETGKEKLNELVEKIESASNTSADKLESIVEKADDLKKQISQNLLDDLRRDTLSDPAINKALKDAIDHKDELVDDLKEYLDKGCDKMIELI